ncbi:MAG: arginine--tRNA ligase [Deltaproteobacteria bacterium]|nr:arginine--tRNA ligase [Deltaproteobacteria bacterium]
MRGQEADPVKERAQQIIAATLARCVEKGLLPPLPGEATVEAPKNPAHGDWSSNAAMLLSKPAGKRPRDVAQLLLDNLVDDAHVVTKAEIAGPGFLNLWISSRVWLEALAEVLAKGASYGRSEAGKGRPVMVEYVSANPTGPMHVGHGRGAVVGDALATLLGATGFKVTREYYVNDAGGQVKQLGRALFMRYREQCGLPLPRPDLPAPPADPRPPRRRSRSGTGTRPWPGSSRIRASTWWRSRAASRRSTVTATWTPGRPRSTACSPTSASPRCSRSSRATSRRSTSSSTAGSASGRCTPTAPSTRPWRRSPPRGTCSAACCRPPRTPPTPRTTSPVSSCSSGPPRSATTRTGRCRSRTAATRTSPPTSPTTRTSWTALRTGSSTSGGRTMAATSSASRRRSRRSPGARAAWTWCWCRWSTSSRTASRTR